MSYTSTQQTAYPGTTGATVQNGYNSAMSAYSTPYTPYSGQLVAGNNQVQYDALGAEAGLGAYQPSMAGAQSNWTNSGPGASNEAGLAGYQAQTVTPGSTTAYTGGTGAGGLSTSGMDLSGYMNPYTQQVINTTMTGLNNQLAQTNNASDAAATQAGAFGGDRAAIVNAQNAYNTNQVAAQTMAGLNSSNYTNAETQAQTDLSRQLSAGQTQTQLGLQGQEANQSAGLQATGLESAANQSLMSMGQNQSALALQAAQGNQFAGLQSANLDNTVNGAVYQMGTGLQNTSQAQDTANYQQFQNGIQWPITMAGLGAQTTAAYNPALSGQGLTTATTPGPSTASQIVAGLTAGAGITSALGGVGAIGNGLGSAYNYLTGSGTTAANTIDAASNIENTTSDLADTASTASDGLFDIFRNGGRVGYADGGGVDEDDGTWLAAGADDDTRNEAPGLLTPAPYMMASASSTNGSPGTVPTVMSDAGPVGGGNGLSLDAIGGGAGGVVIPPGAMTGSGSSASPAATDQSGPSPSAAQYGPPAPAAQYGPDAPPAQMGPPAPPQGLPGSASPSMTDPMSGGLANYASLPVPPIPPDTPPAPGTQTAPPMGDLTGADPTSRIGQSSDPASALPGSSQATAPPGRGLAGAGPGMAPATPPGSGQGLAGPGMTNMPPPGAGQGLGGVRQPQPGTPGAPTGLAGANQGMTGTKNTPPPGDWLSNLYSQNPGALALIKAGAAMMSSRDPHFGVALGQGLAAGAGELDTVQASRQQQALRMQQQADLNAYRMGQLGNGAARNDISRDRAAIYGQGMSATEQLKAAQAAVARAKVENPTVTGAQLQNKAINDLVTNGMPYPDAYKTVMSDAHNFDATNTYRNNKLTLVQSQQAALEANRNRGAQAQANGAEDKQVRATMANLAAQGKPVPAYADLLGQIRSGRAAAGPAPVPGQAAKEGAFIYNPDTKQWNVRHNNTWQPTTAPAGAPPAVPATTAP